MSKFVKEMIVSDIESRIEEVRDFVVVDSARLDAITNNGFRLKLREKGISALTVKNSLARRAFANIGVDGMEDVLKGPSTLVWGGEDIVQLSKEMTQWAKDIDNLDIKGGITEGNTLNSNQIENLSKSPGRTELIGNIVASILNPGAQLVASIVGPSNTIAGCIKNVPGKKNTQKESGTIAQIGPSNTKSDLASPNEECSNIEPGAELQISPPFSLQLQEKFSMGGNSSDSDIQTHSLKFLRNGKPQAVNSAFISSSASSDFVLIGWHTFSNARTILDIVLNEWKDESKKINVFKNFGEEKVCDFVLSEENSTAKIETSITVFEETQAGRLVLNTQNAVWELWYADDPIFTEIEDAQALLVITCAASKLTSEFVNLITELTLQAKIAFSKGNHQKQFTNILKNLLSPGI